MICWPKRRSWKGELLGISYPLIRLYDSAFRRLYRKHSLHHAAQIYIEKGEFRQPALIGRGSDPDIQYTQGQSVRQFCFYVN